MRPRWTKVLRDLRASGARTAMVVLSIGVGVFAYGAIATTRTVIGEELRRSYLATNPASATLTTEGFDEGLLDAARNVPGVAEAEGARAVSARVQTGPATWSDAVLYVIPDDGDRRIGTLAPWAGAWPPRDKTVQLERTSPARAGVAVGGSIRVALIGQEPRAIAVAGLVHDLGLSPAEAASQIVGYVTLDTLAWLGGPRTYNELRLVVAEGRDDKAHIEAVTARVERAVERSGRRVLATDVPTPLQHPAEAVLPAVLELLTGLSVLALLISTFLIVNTISAILVQQTRQIGVMKALGARTAQLAGMYFALAAAFGVVALCIAVPAGWLAAWGLTRFLAAQLNVDIGAVRLPLEVVATQALLALLVPMVASAFPVLGVVRRPARVSLSGAVEGPARATWIDRLIGRLRALGRPTQLALRNTFRRRGRLARTLAALTLGGAVFVAVMTLQASLDRTLTASIATQRHDVEVQLGRPYRAERVAAVAASAPGVSAVEGLGRAMALPVGSDGTTGEAVNLRALRADSRLFTPRVVDGRWLVPGDDRAVVLTTNYRAKHPGARVGDSITLRVGDEDHTWRIVGFVEELIPPVAPAWAYVPLEGYGGAVGGAGQVDTLRVVTARHDPASQAAAGADLERRLASAGLEVQLIRTRAEDRALLDRQFGILIAVLTLMALLIGTVGGLGLSGTMSINVLERTREIGVLRAIGASDGAVRRIVLSEGLTIGVIAWLAGVAVSVPLSYLMCVAMGLSLLGTPLAWAYSLGGAGLWLVIVLAIASIASLLPARAAARLTVREVLAYE